MKVKIQYYWYSLFSECFSDLIDYVAAGRDLSHLSCLVAHQTSKSVILGHNSVGFAFVYLCPELKISRLYNWHLKVWNGYRSCGNMQKPRRKHTNGDCFAYFAKRLGIFEMPVMQLFQRLLFVFYSQLMCFILDDAYVLWLFI